MRQRALTATEPTWGRKGKEKRVISMRATSVPQHYIVFSALGQLVAQLSAGCVHGLCLVLSLLQHMLF